MAIFNKSTLLIFFTILFFTFSDSARGCDENRKDPEKFPFKVLEKKPNEKLATYVKDLFAMANMISVRYIPNANMPRYVLKKESLENGWRYTFSYKCPLTCEKNSIRIQDYLSSGLKLDKECPDPFYARIDLVSDGHKETSIFVHQSGRCFSVGKVSYYTERNFGEFLKPSKLYPDFVGSKKEYTEQVR